jgi:hypothetical protein
MSISGKVTKVTPGDLRKPAGKVYDLLKGYFWTEPGGWLTCIGEGADRVIVMVARELSPQEAAKIPKEMDGVPVEVKNTGVFSIG